MWTRKIFICKNKMHLTLAGALREREVAGLTPEDIDFDAALSCILFLLYLFFHNLSLQQKMR